MNYLIALCSSLPSGKQTSADLLSHALWHMEGLGLQVRERTGFYVSPAQPSGAGPDYVNAVVNVHADHEPHAVRERLDRIEAALDRAEGRRGQPRMVDLDLLACGAQILPDELTVRRWMALSEDERREAPVDTLVLPHPGLHRRGFVLVPLAELAPDWRHPVTGQSTTEMLSALPAEAVAGVGPLGRIEQTDKRDVAE
ncbi:2-amino-4-hydroxy-6-hydroxymethyldihydropteridine diphosphokinase [Halovulum dunhuangense]|uniref:2-amino-4-hydroxy-6-hydroxymethyldihydropteridine pyrophosphokinase n=1 Tax=Halovulum dunhuangense TaxID=1505036 RepID=A0A849L5B6_9RHOB|nr:2-amino-4-hydroxy-6-hydroxymethyldihydropteridine diphosphokinase [Halovulum dunhuangense]NNU81559.1 2-amino-4-hydroxy-6-hydroxymethyldihydropteridine diphosphokinase [Halovulum dunhuangense]